MPNTLLITGPPGAGKSTACEEFSKTADGTWAFIEQDAIRQLVKAGFKDPSDPWTKETEMQMNASIDISGDMARRYQQRKINCIIDCFISLEPYTLDKWLDAFEDITYKIIVILAEAETVLARNNQRTGDNRLKEAQVRDQHKLMSAWRNDPRATIIDSTNMSIPDVVHAMQVTANR